MDDIDDYWNLNPNPKNSLNQSNDGQDWMIDRDKDYEDRAVKEVMRLLGKKKEIKNLEQDAWEDGRINFPVFHNKYPSFPVYFGTKKIPKAYEWDLYTMWRSGFAKSSIWKAYDELYRYAAEDNWQWVGLIFQLPGARYAVFNNYTIGMPQGYATLVTLNNVQYWIEPLKSLISRVSKREMDELEEN